MRRRLTSLSIISIFFLSACGVKGQLDTPPPMWGDKSKAEQTDKASDDSSKN